eukprot:scaffold158148_cov30-Tisochrysis_lutea.AAC.3
MAASSRRGSRAVSSAREDSRMEAPPSSTFWSQRSPSDSNKTSAVDCVTAAWRTSASAVLSNEKLERNAARVCLTRSERLKNSRRGRAHRAHATAMPAERELLDAEEQLQVGHHGKAGCARANLGRVGGARPRVPTKQTRRMAPPGRAQVSRRRTCTLSQHLALRE